MSAPRPEAGCALCPTGARRDVPPWSRRVVLTGRPNQSAVPMVTIAVIFCRRTLSGNQVVLADFFADRYDNALPADHRAQSQRHGDSDFPQPGMNFFALSM